MIFTKRTKPPKPLFTHTFPDKVRCRLIATLAAVCKNSQYWAPGANLEAVLYELQPRLLEEYGGYRTSTKHSLPVNPAPDEIALHHFLSCTDEEVLDFLELLFHCWEYRCGNRGVQAVNDVLREEAIGYEFTDYLETIGAEKVTRSNGIPGNYPVHRVYPVAIKKESQIMHEHVVKPCLTLLQDPRFKVANSEMLAAYEHHREGRLTDAFTACGSAFESVLKTLCVEKGLKYDAHKDTCSKLVAICVDGGLVPPFYQSVFDSVATVRNRLSSAHGRGPVPQFTGTPGQLTHLLNTTAAHVVYLGSLL